MHPGLFNLWIQTNRNEHQTVENRRIQVAAAPVTSAGMATTSDLLTSGVRNASWLLKTVKKRFLEAIVIVGDLTVVGSFSSLSPKVVFWILENRTFWDIQTSNAGAKKYETFRQNLGITTTSPAFTNGSHLGFTGAGCKDRAPRVSPKPVRCCFFEPTMSWQANLKQLVARTFSETCFPSIF